MTCMRKPGDSAEKEECIECNPGYNLGTDSKCHKNTTNTTKCASKYEIFKDGKCQYTTPEYTKDCWKPENKGVCMTCKRDPKNAATEHCIECNPGHNLGTDMKCHKSTTNTTKCPTGYF